MLVIACWRNNQQQNVVHIICLYFLRKFRSLITQNYADAVFSSFYIDFLWSALGSVLSLYTKQVQTMCFNWAYAMNLSKLTAHPLHPLCSEYALLPSWRRYSMPRMRTKRSITSFAPCSIQQLNKLWSDVDQIRSDQISLALCWTCV